MWTSCLIRKVNFFPSRLFPFPTLFLSLPLSSATSYFHFPHSHSFSFSSTSSSSSSSPSPSSPPTLSPSPSKSTSKSKSPNSHSPSPSSSSPSSPPSPPISHYDKRVSDLSSFYSQHSVSSYPNDFTPSTSLSSLLSLYSESAPGSRYPHHLVSLSGRINSCRHAGGIIFFTVQFEFGKYQVAAMKHHYKVIPIEMKKMMEEEQQAEEKENKNLCDPMSDENPFSPTERSIQQSSYKWLLSHLHSSPPFPFLSTLHRGDIISVIGFPGRTQTNEFSIIPIVIRLLSPCLYDIPNGRIEDMDILYRQRYLGFMVNDTIQFDKNTMSKDKLSNHIKKKNNENDSKDSSPSSSPTSTLNPSAPLFSPPPPLSKSLDVFLLRSRLLSLIRSYLTTKLSFLEVETPILWPSPGGAIATPFITSSNSLSSTHRHLPLYLRIAPELFLKQLVIGGFGKVFEISKVFRNEGIDATHNVEFTTIELYKEYSNYREMMKFTEILFRYLYKEVYGEYYRKNGGKMLLNILDNSHTESNNNLPPPVIDLSLPFNVIDIIPFLCNKFNIPSLPNPNNPSSLPSYLSLLATHHIPLPSSPLTLPRIIDQMISHYIEPLCVHPTFIIHHPLCMSPLSKVMEYGDERNEKYKYLDTEGNVISISERFELFIGGKEIVNSYSELNNPMEQRERFNAQKKRKEERNNTKGSDVNESEEEDNVIDEDFCKSLEYGLPPTGGWGMGFDRLVMLFSGMTTIRDVILFPVLKATGESGKGK